MAIKKSIELGATYHIILNPDIIFQADAISALTQFMDSHPDIGSVMPNIIYPDGRSQRLCKLLPTPFDIFARRLLPKSLTTKRNERYEMHFMGYDKPWNCPNLSGCFMFLRTDILKQIGGFDDRFFMYFEDTDLIRRIHQVSITAFYPNATIIHAHKAEHRTSKTLLKISIESAIKYFNKYGWLFDKERCIFNKRAQTDDAYIQKVCTQIFEQWRPLLKERECISIMLWVGDGSELLDYAGNMDDVFEWARFIGNANKPFLDEDEPTETSLHVKKQNYISNAPIMTYGILKKIIACLKSEARSKFPQAKVRVGETLDIGPEFAISDFKYNRHPELCANTSNGHSILKNKCIDATALLNADERYYAAYPQGIPEGTPFGTFLGKQAERFLKEMDFDYLWLSNGLGFSSDPWGVTGKIFDGENYYPEKLALTKDRVFNFWKLFRKECSMPLETRGTNNSVGIDYASDGVPLYDIYNADLDITAPPNSPWAALNDNFGLEIMGHMTRICELPTDKFPFRYYIHDPWWVNSPWYDRYDGAPSDIYLPMAISRLNAEGKIETANSFNILSIDNSYGDMPDSCVNEPIPHILKAEKNAADEPAPLVWVYPMREYTTTQDASLIKEMNCGDHYICDAINDGFPLCCVVSTDNFLKHNANRYSKSILVSPVPENEAVLKQIINFANQGIVTLMYGTSDKLKTIQEFNGIVKIDVEKNVNCIREALERFGYHISFTKKVKDIKSPTLAIARHDNGLFVSVYNTNTTTDTHLRFPLGAPILCGTETEIIDGKSTYRFSRGEQRECRVFVEQSDGVISCHEAPPVNARYRRAIRISGLNDATVHLFTEKNCECAVSLQETNNTPEFDSRFSSIYDEIHGDYLKGEHINGEIYFLIGRKNK